MDGCTSAICSCLLHLKLCACFKGLPVKHRYSGVSARVVPHVGLQGHLLDSNFCLRVALCAQRPLRSHPVGWANSGKVYPVFAPSERYHQNGSQKLVTLTIQRRANSKQTQQQQQSCHCIAADVSRSAYLYCGNLEIDLAMLTLGVVCSCHHVHE